MSPPDGKKTANAGKVIDGAYTLHANDITIQARAPEGPDASKGAYFMLDAQGGGADKKDGHLWLKASGTACMLCDTACVAIQTKTKQEILIECDDTGEITIHQGKLLTDPTIVLEAGGHYPVSRSGPRPGGLQNRDNQRWHNAILWADGRKSK